MSAASPFEKHQSKIRIAYCTGGRPVEVEVLFASPGWRRVKVNRFDKTNVIDIDERFPFTSVAAQKGVLADGTLACTQQDFELEEIAAELRQFFFPGQ